MKSTSFFTRYKLSTTQRRCPRVEYEVHTYVPRCACPFLSIAHPPYLEERDSPSNKANPPLPPTLRLLRLNDGFDGKTRRELASIGDDIRTARVHHRNRLDGTEADEHGGHERDGWLQGRSSTHSGKAVSVMELESEIDTIAKHVPTTQLLRCSHNRFLGVVVSRAEVACQQSGGRALEFKQENAYDHSRRLSPGCCWVSLGAGIEKALMVTVEGISTTQRPQLLGYPTNV